MISKVPLVQKLPRYLSTLSTQIFTKPELSIIIKDFARAINDPLDANPDAYIDYLVQNNQIQKIILKGSKTKTERFFIRTPSVYQIATSLKNQAYLSHSTAAHILGLIDREPSLIYVSTEGPERIKSEIYIDQNRIDEVFSKSPRISKDTFNWNGYQFVQLTAQHTGMIGVININGIPLTNVERTLLDMTVRPQYSGSTKTILKAYKNALHLVDVNKLISMLEIMEFIYPYHQAVGYYLSKAGYHGQELSILKGKPMPFRFYLDYGMKRTLFSKEWKVYYEQDT